MRNLMGWVIVNGLIWAVSIGLAVLVVGVMIAGIAFLLKLVGFV